MVEMLDDFKEHIGGYMLVKENGSFDEKGALLSTEVFFLAQGVAFGVGGPSLRLC